MPGYAAHLQQIGARTITYDDGQNTQNESINYLGGFDPDDDSTGPSATFPGEPGYSTATSFRMGDTVSNLTGVLDYQFGGDAASSGATWRVRAINDGDNTFTHANARPDTPPDVGGTLKVASFNVLNYFTTLDAGGATTAIGLAPRGANTAAEFQRQTDKLVNFIATLDADVIGLTELENDFFDSNPNDSNPEGNAIAYLVGQLNATARRQHLCVGRSGQPARQRSVLRRRRDCGRLHLQALEGPGLVRHHDPEARRQRSGGRRRCSARARSAISSTA